jgi:glucosyl-dolichyl phosphate glucuronosyltransferase
MSASQSEQDGATQEVSIVVCTLDRQREVARAIRSILSQDVDPRRFEIVVVDNCSRDRTREVIAQIQRDAPNVRYVYEPVLGLSTARNTGTREARAPIVAFFDDDATAEPGWLAAMLQIIRDHPEAGAAGGPIEVGWPCRKPEWMPQDLQGYYGACDYGGARCFLTFPQYPYGSNMFVRREHLAAIGGFREEVGAKGQNIMSGDELDVFQRLSEIGVKVVYEPSARVRHWVPESRITRKWLLRRAYKHGFSNTRLAFIQAGATRLTWTRLLGRALFQSAMACVSGTLGLLGRVGTSVVTSRFARMTYWAGVARGARDGVLSGAG